MKEEIFQVSEMRLTAVGSHQGHTDLKTASSAIESRVASGCAVSRKTKPNTPYATSVRHISSRSRQNF